ncbi:MAG: 50S ribosomal protein L25/general stress protein Ctc [Parachlamydiaceae bacterium]|nr:50S ribosomal protein L25/general stress protein Ctc [Parachlamydiaceae bacterium]
MKLQVVKRTTANKCEAKRLRREGFIPSILYVKGQAGEPIAVNSVDINAFLRNVKSGHLPTSKFTLVDESGKERTVIVKEIQYNIINYNVTHLDFEELVENHPINVKVPIECIGESVGIKLGGVLRQPIRHVKVRCFDLKNIPTHFILDVTDLGLRDKKRLSDLDIPEHVRPLDDLNQVVAVIVKR